MSEDERPRAAILVSHDWTEVYEKFDELRRRWRLARKQNDLLELTSWEGPLLLDPYALKAACNPADREQDDAVEIDVVWPEVEDPDMAQAIKEVSGQQPRTQCEGPPRNVVYIHHRRMGAGALSFPCSHEISVARHYEDAAELGRSRCRRSDRVRAAGVNEGCNRDGWAAGHHGVNACVCWVGASTATVVSGIAAAQCGQRRARLGAAAGIVMSPVVELLPLWLGGRLVRLSGRLMGR
jgi:hypothetical protein